MTTTDEAEAVCRALSTSHIYAVNSTKIPALFNLAALVQSVETAAAADVFAREALPILRRILNTALVEAPPADASDWATTQRREAHLFLLKVLIIYRQRGEAPLIIRAARDPKMSDANIWSVIFDLADKRHPEAADIYEGLRNPLLDGRVGVAYLDFANAMATRGATPQHPFDSNAGVARLLSYLSDRDPENYSHATIATAAIPFVSSDRRDALMSRADEHPDAFVRLEGARALATTGSETGRQRLAQLCLDPRLAERAVRYLDELGLGALVPSKAREPGFQAMAAMCSWLMYPTEFGRPPDAITEYDTRELHWPPTGDNRRLWLFKYRFEPQGEGDEATEGVGLVGSTTFSLTGQATADLPPEDIYGLHCCWELEIQQDPRAPKKRSAAIGRKMLAAANPGFPAP